MSTSTMRTQHLSTRTQQIPQDSLSIKEVSRTVVVYHDAGAVSLLMYLMRAFASMSALIRGFPEKRLPSHGDADAPSATSSTLQRLPWAWCVHWPLLWLQTYCETPRGLKVTPSHICLSAPQHKPIFPRTQTISAVPRDIQNVDFRGIFLKHLPEGVK